MKLMRVHFTLILLFPYIWRLKVAACSPNATFVHLGTQYIILLPRGAISSGKNMAKFSHGKAAIHRNFTSV